MQNIGARIRTWREERNLSREDLAEQAGLSVSFLAALEDDGLLPALGPLHKVARALGVRLGTFMDPRAGRHPRFGTYRRPDHRPGAGRRSGSALYRSGPRQKRPRHGTLFYGSGAGRGRADQFPPG